MERLFNCQSPRCIKSFSATSAFICSLVFTLSVSANTLQLRPIVPPENATRLLLAPDNTVTFTLMPQDEAVQGTVTLSLGPFWRADKSSVEVHFKSEDEGGDEKAQDKQNKKEIDINSTEPVVLQIGEDTNEAVASKGIVWGYIKAEYGDKKLLNLPLLIGAFGPAIGKDGELSVAANGRVKVVLDMSEYLLYGNSAEFHFTTFSSASHESQPLFVSSENKAVATLTAQYSANDSKIWLEIDTSGFQLNREYRGALRTTVNGKPLIDQPLMIKQTPWTRDAVLAPVQPVVSRKREIELMVRTASDQAVHGISVTSATAATDDFNPAADLAVSLDGISLAEMNFDKPGEIRNRSLAPGEIKKITVKTKRDLPVGKHEAILKLGALNVDADKEIQMKVAFVVRHPWGWALGALIAGVLLSYVITKGIKLGMLRSNLRKRIKDIKSTSWLKNDHWGAFPIVRAFVRVELADKALNHKPRLDSDKVFFWLWQLVSYGFKYLSRLVTAPQLISNELDEVSKRFEVFKKLNKVALEWGVVPSAANGITGMDYRIVYRANKVLRDIVSQLAQLQNGEDIPADIIARIDRLATWSHMETLIAEYPVSQCGDIDRLLLRIDLRRFEPDVKTLTALTDNLEKIEQLNIDKDSTEAATAAIATCRGFRETGIKPITDALRPILNLQENKNIKNAGLFETIKKIEVLHEILRTSVREIVRDKVEKLKIGTELKSMQEILTVEDHYILLKLFWEQRECPERCQTLADKIKQDISTEVILKDFDQEVWDLLIQSGTLRIVNPADHGSVEQYTLIDLKVECTDPRADTFLFKHGLQYEWKINYADNQKPLTPVTRCPVVTQFIPQIRESRKVKVSVIVRWGNKTFHVGEGDLKEICFKTIETKRFRDLWPINTPEILGLIIAMVLAIIAGLQSDAFIKALEGSWKEYLALLAWGVGADQTKTLIQNLDSMFKHT